tara:strand:- start:12923 stop:14095 length:1173 start_codon:yes stop_codon:yes gene_type:complete
MKILKFFLKLKYYISPSNLISSIFIFIYSLIGQNTKYPNYLKKFETKIANYFNSKYALTFSNGTTAFIAILYAVGVKKNSKILISKLSFPSIISSILRVGAVPIFLDFNKDLQIKKINIEKIKEAEYLLLTHAFGIPQKKNIIDYYLNINPRLIIIEDISHSQGAKIENNFTGSIGKASFMSMQGDKAINAGEGGVAFTNDETIYNRMIYLMHLNRDFSNEKKDINFLSKVGFLGKGRMNPLGAIKASSDLNKLEKRNAKIRKKFQILYDNLKFSKELIFPDVDNFQDTGGYHYGFPVFISSKITLKNLKKYFSINKYNWPNLDKSEKFQDPEKFTNIIYEENPDLTEVFNESEDLRDDLYFFDLKDIFFTNNFIIKKKILNFKKNINEA